MYTKAVHDFVKEYNQQNMSLSYTQICERIIDKRTKLLDKAIENERINGNADLVLFNDGSGAYHTAKDYGTVSITEIKNIIKSNNYQFVKLPNQRNLLIYVPVENEIIDYMTVLNHILNQLSADVNCDKEAVTNTKGKTINFVNKITIRRLSRYTTTIADLIALAFPNRKYKYDMVIKYDSIDIIRATNSISDKYQFNKLKNCIYSMHKTSLSRKQIENICSKHKLLSPTDIKNKAKNVKLEKKKKQ